MSSFEELRQRAMNKGYAVNAYGSGKRMEYWLVVGPQQHYSAFSLRELEKYIAEMPQRSGIKQQSFEEAKREKETAGGFFGTTRKEGAMNLQPVYSKKGKYW